MKTVVFLISGRLEIGTDQLKKNLIRIGGRICKRRFKSMVIRNIRRISMTD